MDGQVSLCPINGVHGEGSGVTGDEGSERESE
jgi:hypothetical protein